MSRGKEPIEKEERSQKHDVRERLAEILKAGIITPLATDEGWATLMRSLTLASEEILRKSLICTPPLRNKLLC